MVADCRVFVDMGRFYLQSNTAIIALSALTINGMSLFVRADETRMKSVHRSAF